MIVDAIDNRLLNLLQKNFPLTPKPFEILANQLGLSEAEVIKRVNKLKNDGIIRRIGGSFNSKKLGYVSTLCAMKVNQAKIENTIQVVNRYPEVTHNYLRDHEYNIWFTIITETGAQIQQIIKEIKQETGPADLINFPAIQVFKIDVNFQLNEG